MEYKGKVIGLCIQDTGVAWFYGKDRLQGTAATCEEAVKDWSNDSVSRREKDHNVS